MKNLTVRVMAEIAVLSALGFVLLLIEKSYSRAFWPNGGSLGIYMISIVVMTYRRGLLPGMICGLIISLLGMIPPYTIGDTWYKLTFQITLDYILPNPLLAFGVWMFRGLYLRFTGIKAVICAVCGVCVGSIFKMLSHFWAGVLFWEVYCDYTKYANVYTYSFIYNGTCILISMFFTAIVMAIFASKYPQFTKLYNKKVEK